MVSWKPRRRTKSNTSSEIMINTNAGDEGSKEIQKTPKKPSDESVRNFTEEEQKDAVTTIKAYAIKYRNTRCEQLCEYIDERPEYAKLFRRYAKLNYYNNKEVRTAIQNIHKYFKMSGKGGQYSKRMFSVQNIQNIIKYIQSEYKCTIINYKDNEIRECQKEDAVVLAYMMKSNGKKINGSKITKELSENISVSRQSIMGGKEELEARVEALEAEVARLKQLEIKVTELETAITTIYRRLDKLEQKGTTFNAQDKDQLKLLERLIRNDEKKSKQIHSLMMTTKALGGLTKKQKKEKAEEKKEKGKKPKKSETVQVNKTAQTA